MYGEVAKYDAQRKRFVLKDSRIIEEEVNVLCSATGFQTEYSLFAEKDIARLGVESDGLYLYNNMLPTQLDRIAFVGSQLVSYQVCSVLALCASSQAITVLVVFLK